MTLLDAIMILVTALAVVYVAVRLLAARVWPPVIDLEPEWELRRSARVERMDDFRRARERGDGPEEP